jgi:Flp pilus assembly protein TadB
LQDRLDRSGAGISAGRYRFTVVATMFAVAFVIYAVTGTASLAVPPAVAIGMAPRLFFQRRQAKVLAERRRAWPETVRDVLANLLAGHSLHRALCLLGQSGPLPLRDTWRRYERNAAALDVSTALELARAELADPVADRVIEVFVAAHEHGRDVIVSVLRSVADNVTKDLQLLEQIATGQTEIRSQAVVAVILPFAVLAFLVAANDSYRSFYRTTGGWIVVSIGVCMAVGGWKLITLLGRVPVDKRVLVGRGAAQ